MLNTQLVSPMKMINEKYQIGLDHVRIELILLSLTLVVFSVLWLRRRATKTQSPPLPPGPRGLPLVGYLPFLGTDLHIEFAKLATTYGPIFKFWLGTKLCVVISSPSLVREVVHDKDTIFANRDAGVCASVATHGGHDVAFSSYGPDWKKLRRIFVREMLNNSVLDSLYGLRRDEVNKSLRYIYEQKINTPVNVGSLAFQTAINAITSMMTGGTSTQEDSSAIEGRDKFKKAAEDLVVLLGKPNVSDLFPALARFDIQGIERDTKKVTELFDGLFDSAIEKRRKYMNDNKNKSKDQEDTKVVRKDFLQYLLELNEREDGAISMAEIKALLMDTFLGATDTLTTTVEWTISELLKHPKIFSKVNEELTQVVGLNNKVEEFHFPNLTYLSAVMKEILRLHPPGPLLIPRYPSETTTVGGYTIPKRSSIYLNVWAIQRDPEIWEDPLEFKPERFLKNDGGQFNFNNNSGNNFTFLPFGSGRRICVGIPLGERMVTHIIASLLHSFEWKLTFDSNKLDLSEKFGLVLKKRDPLVAVPTPRLSNLELYLT